MNVYVSNLPIIVYPVIMTYSVDNQQGERGAGSKRARDEEKGKDNFFLSAIDSKRINR